MYGLPLLCKYCLKDQYLYDEKAISDVKILSGILPFQIEKPNITKHRHIMQQVLSTINK